MSGLAGGCRKRLVDVSEVQKRGDLDELSKYGRFVRVFVVCPGHVDFRHEPHLD